MTSVSAMYVKGNVNHPSGLYYNDIIQSLEVRMSETAGKGKPNNVTLKNKGGKAYDQNKAIHSFRELKIALEGKTDLYDKIFIQSKTIATMKTTEDKFEIFFINNR